MNTATRPLQAPRSNAAGSRNAARKSTSEFTASQRVRVNDDVRPVRYAGQQGSIVEVRRVVPLAIVRELARQGKRPNNGDIEIGVRLGKITRSNNFTTAWFLPHELAAVEVGQRRPEAVCGLADAANDQVLAVDELRAS
ncbi:MAG: hypothetical protein ABR972_11725 [Acidimicrobiales bacterium]|jgi:hypothetical protein